MQRRIIATACVLAWVLGATSQGYAAPQDVDSAEDARTDEPKEAKGWSLDAGGAGAVGPVRNGGRRYLFHPVPFAELSYDDVFEASTRDGVSWTAYDDRVWRAGPLFDLDPAERGAAGLHGRRFATLLGTGGIGGFAERSLGEGLKTRLELTEGVLARRGLKAELSAVRTVDLSSGFELDLGAKMRAGTRSYVESIYRMPPVATPRIAAGGPPRKRRTDSAGMTTIGPTAEMRYALGKSDVLTATLEGNRLVGAAVQSQATKGNLGRHSAGTFELGWRRSFLSTD